VCVKKGERERKRESQKPLDLFLSHPRSFKLRYLSRRRLRLSLRRRNDESGRHQKAFLKKVDLFDNDATRLLLILSMTRIYLTDLSEFMISVTEICSTIKR